MSKYSSLCKAICDLGFNFTTGVPDSTFKMLLSEIEAQPELNYVPAVSENVAVGLAVGAYLGGRKSLLLMQNSGLALALNPLASLASLYRIPLVLIVGWRGHDGKDSPEHETLGRATLALLEAIGLRCYIPESSSLVQNFRDASSKAEKERLPYALVCRPGVLT